MLSKITLANHAGEDVVLHEDSTSSKRSVKTAKGLVGLAAPRLAKRARPQAHGSINETRWQEGKTVVLDCEVMSRTSIEDALAEYRAVMAPVQQTLDYGAALLKWTEGATGNKLQMAVVLDAECEPILEEAYGFVAYQLQLFAEDPRAYAQTLTTQAGATITGNPVQTQFAVGAGSSVWRGDFRVVPLLL